MGEPAKPPSWTLQEEALLRSVRLLAEVDTIRGGKDRPASKPAWQRFLESAGGVALITVLLGGIAGGVITAQLEARQKERELAVERERAEEERKGVSHRQLLAARLTVVREAMDLVGRVLAAGEDLIVLTGPEWRLDAAGGEVARESTRRTKEELRVGWNSADAEWRARRHAVWLLLAAYTSEDRDVVTAWRVAEEGIDLFLRCARRYYVEHATGSGEPATACAAEHDAALDAVSALAAAAATTGA